VAVEVEGEVAVVVEASAMTVQVFVDQVGADQQFRIGKDFG